MLVTLSEPKFRTDSGVGTDGFTILQKIESYLNLKNKAPI